MHGRKEIRGCRVRCIFCLVNVQFVMWRHWYNFLYFSVRCTLLYNCHVKYAYHTYIVRVGCITIRVICTLYMLRRRVLDIRVSHDKLYVSYNFPVFRVILSGNKMTKLFCYCRCQYLMYRTTYPYKNFMRKDIFPKMYRSLQKLES